MSRGDYPGATYEPEEIALRFSFKVAASTGAVSLIRGGGGHVKSVGTMASGVCLVTLNTPYPPQMLQGHASPSKSAGSGIDGNTCEVPTADYDATAGTFKVYYIVQDGTPAVGTVPAADARISVTCVFQRRNALKYA